VFDCFFSHHVINVPLAFYDFIRMIHNGLPSAVALVVVLYSDFIFINQIRILGALKKSDFGVFSAFFKKLASRASIGCAMLHLSD
jgi:hypothetical protein